MGLGQAPAFQDMSFQSQIFLLINDLFFPQGPGKGPCIVQHVCIIAPVNADDELCPEQGILPAAETPGSALRIRFGCRQPPQWEYQPCFYRSFRNFYRPGIPLRPGIKAEFSATARRNPASRGFESIPVQAGSKGFRVFRVLQCPICPGCKSTSQAPIGIAGCRHGKSRAGGLHQDQSSNRTGRARPARRPGCTPPKSAPPCR